jgi:hypothetical protein
MENVFVENVNAKIIVDIKTSLIIAKKNVKNYLAIQALIYVKKKYICVIMSAFIKVKPEKKEDALDTVIMKWVMTLQLCIVVKPRKRIIYALETVHYLVKAKMELAIIFVINKSIIFRLVYAEFLKKIIYVIKNVV